jgi:signal transduction histidine kinase
VSDSGDNETRRPEGGTPEGGWPEGERPEGERPEGGTPEGWWPSSRGFGRGPRGPRGPRHHHEFERYRGPHRHWDAHYNYPRPRPPWWPHDEPWPPAGEFPWRRVKRSFFVRFAIGVTLVAVLLVAAPIVIIGQILSAVGLSSGAYRVASALFALIVILAIVRTARSARRFAVPFGDLIEASGKVGAGDFSARVEMPRHGVRELRWLVEAFNSMAARLETDERQRRSLLADVSHELRTPLAVLRGELEAMVDGVHAIDEAHLTAAVDQIAMVTKLVEDLRTLALAEAGALALQKEPTDLSVLANESASSFEGLAAMAGVTLAVRMPDDLPLVDLDPLRIQQVIGNLVANALRYAPSGSVVSIVGGTRAGVVTISVADSGPGIPPEMLPHVFERFAKAADSRGSGLGLAIARQLVEAHGGTIAADSPTGGGTTIAFELPTQPGA